MRADLSACRLKLARAKRDLKALDDKVGAYMDPPPFRFAIEPEGKGGKTIVFHIDREPDPEWAIDLGEIAYQSRSALDLLIVQLVIDNTDQRPRGRTQFPIFTDRHEYITKGKRGSSNRDRMLAGVSGGHRHLIDTFQPYNRIGGVEDDPLSILSSITNRDKHRDIHVCLGSVEIPRFQLLQPLIDYQITVELTGEKFRGYPMVDGQKFIGIGNVVPPRESPDATVELKILPMDVSLAFYGDRLITMDDIDAFVLRTERILDAFTKRIKP